MKTKAVLRRSNFLQFGNMLSIARRLMMKHITVVLLFLVSTVAQADLVVLVHGYLGSAASWDVSSVNSILEQSGWRRAGVATPSGLLSPPVAMDGDSFYTVELPSMAPVLIQADLLARMLEALERRHEGEPVILVGHSAGGVVARIALVRGVVKRPKALITIATPHLGTLRAVEALEETDDPFPICMVKTFFTGDLYDILRDSRQVLLDLTPERPGNLLFWLNRQVHPDIDYVSVVRSGPMGVGDELVPVFSQDMNNIEALKGRSRVIALPVSHTLQPADGRVLVDLLGSL
jgi:pimeloyl-ACP methyl ester carboxylesterase